MRKLIIVALMSSLVCAPLMAQDFVGPEKCLSCHNNPGLGDMTGWRASLHANGYSYVPDDSRSLEDRFGVVADHDKNGVDDFKDGLDFNAISSKFDQYKPNAPILSYSAEDGYLIQIGDAIHKVYLTYGGSGTYKQRFMVKIRTSEGESAGFYISPVQYNDVTAEYVTYHPEDWWDSDNNPIFTTASTKMNAAAHKHSMAKGCSGCHVTGLELEQDSNGEWISRGAPIDPATEAMYTDNNVFDLDGDGDLDQMNTTCERCHGPGAEHSATGDKTKIINPANLTAAEANNLCGMCHNRGKSTPNNTFGFPFDDENMVAPGLFATVADFFTDGGGDWPDEKHSVKHRQQFLDFQASSKPTFQFHQVTCYECHDVHNNWDSKHIRSEIVDEDADGNELKMAVRDEDNTLCLACHATHGDFEDISKEMVADYSNNVDAISAVVKNHTFHSYDPEGNGASRCSSCHMPRIAKTAVNYDISSHTFETISPQKTRVYESFGKGMPNSCAVSCHAKEGYPNFGIDISGKDFGIWNTATDLQMADSLLQYFGPNGIWWTLDVTSVALNGEIIPEGYALEQNFPNPFNPSTRINFKLPKASHVTLKVYNSIGSEVANLLNQELQAGSYQITFDGGMMASGIYYYRMSADNFVQTRKMVLVR